LAAPDAVLAILYAAEAFSTAHRKMGRQAAGAGLLPALIATCPQQRFTVVASRQEDLQGLRESLAAARPPRGLHGWPLDKLDRLRGVDALLVADPTLGRWAWSRQWHPAGGSAYSLIGLTHTLSSLAALEALRAIVAAPLEPWDALICTSRCARAAIEAGFAAEAERLARRFGGSAAAWRGPRLPVIPLGCDTHRYAALAAGREAARSRLQIPAGQPVVLCLGRLELHAKAHPGALLQALARAASELGQRPRLLVVGTARGKATRLAWKQGLAAFSRHFDAQLLDGHEQANVDAAWAAADLFATLADSLQETFGLTPVEAMARGLPVIASDWNGYRDTVVDGVTGLLIPTRQPAPGGAQELAGLALKRLGYDAFMADLMRQVVVDEDALAAALLQLLRDPAQRRRLGEAGRRRAAEHYGWDRIAGRIRDLASELTEARRAAGAAAAERRTPLPDPWRQFGSWASAPLPADPIVRLEAGRFTERCRRMRELQLYAMFSTATEPALRLGALEPLIALLEKRLAGAGTASEAGPRVELPAAELAAALPDQPPPELERALAWLAKIGALHLGSPADPLPPP
jgi:glycosyltransferase involved in cell wall biosynthesis